MLVAVGTGVFVLVAVGTGVFVFDPGTGVFVFEPGAEVLVATGTGVLVPVCPGAVGPGVLVTTGAGV